MAFYGNSTGLTNVNDVEKNNMDTTTTNRTCSTSFSNHISRSSIVVPSGYRAIIIVFASANGVYEADAGRLGCRIRIEGSATGNGSEFVGHIGFHDNYAGNACVFRVIDVAAGTYTVRFQVREVSGNIIYNSRGQTDYMSTTCFSYRA
tara:strand:- start:594 stop:1037 length:444 start_codon:yes stop_codon:yes gene_type:complete